MSHRHRCLAEDSQDETAHGERSSPRGGLHNVGRPMADSLSPDQWRTLSVQAAEMRSGTAGVMAGQAWQTKMAATGLPHSEHQN